MKLEELAGLMGKSMDEIKNMLDQNDVIELKLTERKGSEAKEAGKIEVLD